MARDFVGMVHPDNSPLRVADADVLSVERGEIPEPLLWHATDALKECESGLWWSIGEFRYEGKWAYDTAVARRVVRDGEVCLVFGVERDE